MRRLIRGLLPLADLLLAPLVAPAALLLRAVRRAGLERLPACRRVLLAAGILPVERHYYEPFVDARRLRRPLEEERALPGIDWNEAGQLELLDSLAHAEELADVPDHASSAQFHWDNGLFCSGDAEYFYQFLRLRRPARLLEVGAGYSSLLARRALDRNRAEGRPCRHVCIEPYEAPWLEQAGIEVIRRRVEEADPELFAALGPDDLLFIDSSHVIRPQGDVLFEVLEVLPRLKPGVVVHFHDVFSPRDYPRRWVAEQMRLWNEQYLLEAFLCDNRRWRVIGALNFLHHRHYGRLRAKCPRLTPEREPGSLYLQKLS